MVATASSANTAAVNSGWKSVIIDTAGHIDHGKSALVEALTGTHPDRLEEEKRRGITIDLGFAFLDYSGSQVAGIAETSLDRGSGQSKCTISGARSTAAWRCSPTM